MDAPPACPSATYMAPFRLSLQGGGIISQVRERTGAKVHLCDAEPGRRDRVITISLIDGGRCATAVATLR